MFRKTLLAALLAAFVVSPLVAATEQGYRGDANQVVPVATSTPLPVAIYGGSINASLSAFVSPTGVATAAVVDSSGYTYVNVATGSLNSTPSFVDVSEVASAAMLNAYGQVPVNLSNPVTGATAAVAISNGLAVETGIVLQGAGAVATDTITKVSDLASGTTIPFWINVQNTGAVNLLKVSEAGSTATDSASFLAPGDVLNIYVGTNTPNLGLIAPSTGAVGAYGLEIWQ